MAGTGTVTVLFTDLVGSTALAGRLGDDAADGIRRQLFDLVRAAVGTGGGEEVKNTGDGIMAVFTSVVGALDAAAEIQRAVDRYNRGRGSEPVALRVGISVGEASEEDGDWFGAPVVEAARLCDAAAGGQVLVADVVRVLAGTRGSHDLVPVGALELKGLADPFAACELQWVSGSTEASPLPRRLAEAGAMPFVGRDLAIEQLRSAWKRAAIGETGAVLVSGEPGIGKTRLAAQLAAAVRDDGGLVLFGRCDEELSVPYQPFVEALQGWLRHADDASLAEASGPLAGELTRLSPELAARAPHLAAGPAADPETERHRLFEAVARWIGDLAAGAPVLLVIDDLHWAEKSTLLMLLSVLRSESVGGVLVVGTYRDTDLGRTHPLAEVLADLRREHGVARLSLDGLDDHCVADLVAAGAGQELDAAGEALAVAIARETQGNPFFVGEILRHLVESGAVHERDGRWTSDFTVEEIGLPEGVREVIGRRLARLSDAANQVLGVAALAGAEFDLGVIGEVASVTDSVGAIDEALTAGLVRDGGSPGRYAFAHALVRQTLVEELTSARRLALHRDLGLAIERRAGNDPTAFANELARHFVEAAPLGDVERANRYARLASAVAGERYAWDEAIDHMQRLVAALELAPGTERARAEALLELAPSYWTIGDNPRAVETYIAASDLARGTGDINLLGQVVSRLLGNTDPMRLDPRLAPLVEETLALWDESGDPRKVMLLASLGQARAFSILPGDPLEPTRRALDQATLDALGAEGWFLYVARGIALHGSPDVDELDRHVKTLLGFDDPQAAMLSAFLATYVALRRGDVAGVLACSDRLESEARPYGSKPFIAAPFQNRADVALLQGRYDAAEELIARTVEEAGDQPAYLLGVALQRWWLHVLRGDYEAALSIIESVAAVLPEPYQGACALLAWNHQLLGDEASARTVFVPFVELGPAGITPNWTRSGVLHVFAELAYAWGDTNLATATREVLLPYDGQLLLVICTHVPATAAYCLGLCEATLGRADDALAHFDASLALESRAAAASLTPRTEAVLGRIRRT